MMMNYTELDHPRDKEWMLEEMPFKDLMSAQKVALEAVYHDLCDTYSYNTNCVSTSLKEDKEYTYWSGNNFYSVEDVEKVLINEEFYVFSHMYITKLGHMILVVFKVKDIWAEDSVITEEIEHADPIYFLVEY
jgi:hypothetical protein